MTPGALVTENQTAPLTTVQQLDPVYVDVTQSSVEVLRLKRVMEEGRLQRSETLNAAVSLRFEDGQSYAESGTLQFTDVSVEEITGSVRLRAIFSNPGHTLLPGMYVRAVVNEGVDGQALLLPQPAVQRDAKGKAGVYVVNDSGRIESRAVRLARTHGTDWIVLSGLAPGDKVVVGGLQKIRPGALVRLAPEGTQTTAQAEK